LIANINCHSDADDSVGYDTIRYDRRD